MRPTQKNQFRTITAIFLGCVSFSILLALIFQGNSNGFLTNRPTEPLVIVTTGTVKQGDTLARILSSNNIPPLFVYRIQNKFAEAYNLRLMKPGHNYEIVTSTNGLFKKFKYITGPIESYLVARSSSGVYTHHTDKRQTVWMEKTVRGKVTENAYKDLMAQGHNETFVANLIGELGDNIFAWRIDFFTEQRVDDEFEVLLEQEYPVGSDRPLNNVRVLAAYYRGSGTKQKDNYAIRYKSANAKRADYFDLNGEAVRKAFLRAPFNHRSFRISSHYNPKRFHPILRTYRAHHGTDYACPPGTPVVAVGDGVIKSAGWNGGYGRAVDIRHSNKYTSRYGHMSKILVKKGQRITQGQLIGKSGNTGRSTGPHLHFEMHVDGRQRNFLRLNFPAAKSVKAANMEEFKQVRDQHISHMRPMQALAKDFK